MVQRAGVVGVVENTLPFTEVAQHFGRRFAAAATAAAATAATAAASAAAVDGFVFVAQNKILILEQEHPHYRHLHWIGQAGIFVNQRYLNLNNSSLYFHGI